MPLSPSRTLALGLLPPFLLGAALRLFHLAPQVLDGDEIHAVRAAVSMPVKAILTTYQESDNCIPLSALFRALLDSGVHLSEIGFRAPSIVCGLLLLLALPLGVARRLPARVAIVFAWLLAISPLLVFYSRIARSYLPMTLFALAAAAAFAAWWRSLKPGFAVAYVILGGLAVWLHLGAAPIVGAPFLFAVGDLLWGRKEERGRRLLQLGIVAVGIALAVAAFLLPARESLQQLVAEKRQAQSVPGETIGDVLTLHAGAKGMVLVALFWVVALGGLAVLFLRDRRLAAYTLTLAGVQLLGIRLLSPLGLANPLILGRYLLPVLPLVLLWVACALVSPWRHPPPVLPPSPPTTPPRGEEPSAERSSRAGELSLRTTWLLLSRRASPPASPLRPSPLGGVVGGDGGRTGGGWNRDDLSYRLLPLQATLAAAFLLLFALRGPLADRALWASSFMHHNDFLAFYAPRPHLAPEEVPGFYHEMAAAPGPGGVVEYPWSSFAGLRSFHLYQEVHGRRVLVSGPQRLLFAPVLGLRNVVPPGPEGFCASGARFLVVHLHVAREEDRIESPEERRLGEREMRPDLRRTLRSQAEAMAQSLTTLWGPPTWAAPSLRAWDLESACKRGPDKGGA